MKNRFYVEWSDYANAYVIYDSQISVPQNSSGHAMLWGTDHPDLNIVQDECEKMNSSSDYVNRRFPNYPLHATDVNMTTMRWVNQKKQNNVR